MSNITRDAVNDFLMGGGGAPSAKFDVLGRTYKGTIVESEVRQQTEVGTNEPLFWKDGNPKMQAVVTLQTDERDPSIEDDDGRRKLYIKGQMQQAVRDAVREAGESEFRKGGMLAVKYHANGEASQRGFTPPKLYVAQYRPPATDANDLLGANGSAAPQQVAVAATPAPAPVSAADLL